MSGLGRLRVVVVIVAMVVTLFPAGRVAAQANEESSASKPVTVDKPDVPDLWGLRAPDALPGAGPMSPATDPSSQDAALTEVDRARIAARDSRQRVEIVGLRTETSSTFANPDQTLTQELAAAPVRDYRINGVTGLA